MIIIYKKENSWLNSDLLIKEFIQKSDSSDLLLDKI